MHCCLVSYFQLLPQEQPITNFYIIAIAKQWNYRITEINVHAAAINTLRWWVVLIMLLWTCKHSPRITFSRYLMSVRVHTRHNKNPSLIDQLCNEGIFAIVITQNLHQRKQCLPSHDLIPVHVSDVLELWFTYSLYPPIKATLTRLYNAH